MCHDVRAMGQLLRCGIVQTQAFTGSGMFMHRFMSAGVCMGFMAALACATSVEATPAAQPLTEDSVDLSGKQFLADLAGQTPEIRNAAGLYLLGVLDATEGRSWCGYATLKTTSMDDFVFASLRKQPPAQLDRRAAVLIEEALHRRFPCKEVP